VLAGLSRIPPFVYKAFLRSPKRVMPKFKKSTTTRGTETKPALAWSWTGEIFGLPSCSKNKALLEIGFCVRQKTDFNRTTANRTGPDRPAGHRWTTSPPCSA
jgi:hypothetical protein